MNRGHSPFCVSAFSPLQWWNVAHVKKKISAIPTQQRRIVDTAHGSTAHGRPLWPRGRSPRGPTADAAGLVCAKSILFRSKRSNQFFRRILRVHHNYTRQERRRHNHAGAVLQRGQHAKGDAKKDTKRAEFACRRVRTCLLKIFGCTCAYAIRSSTRQGHRRHVCAARWRKIQRYFKGALERRRDANSAVLPSMEAPPSRTAVVGTTEIKEKTMLDDMVAESPPRKGLNKTA